MRKTPSKMTAGQLVLRLVLSILLTFSLLGTVSSVISGILLSSPNMMTAQIKKQDAAEKAYNTLQNKFNLAYNSTAVPAEVYMDTITPELLENIMRGLLETSYAETEQTDWYAPLRKAVTAYFEQYAEENDIAKDDTYTQKLEETIDHAIDIVQDAVDVYHIRTMEDAGIWNKLMRLQMPIWFLAAACAVLSVLLVFFLRKNFCYWVGISAFACGILMTVPSAAILGTGIISHFTLKEPAVYAVYTGMMTQLVQIMLMLGIIFTAAGLVMWIGSLIPNKTKAAGSDA